MNLEELDDIPNFSDRIKRAFELDGRTPHVRGKHRGKYDCPCCGEPSVTFGRKGFSCWHGCTGSDIVKSIYNNLRGKGGIVQRPRSQEQIQPSNNEKEKLLTEEDWDNGLRALAKRFTQSILVDGQWQQSTCSREAIAELERRGLTKEEIAASGIFTLLAGRTEVTGLVHKSFPGTYWTRDKINFIETQWIQGMWVGGAGRDSIVIPRFSFWGSQIGCQLRAMGPVEKGDRYRPLYYYNKYTNYRPASGDRLQYNKSNEAGLTFCNPEFFGRERKTPNRIYLCEGILKPLVASFKHNEIFFGAKSGLFLSSPEQFYNTLLYYYAVGTTELVISPDHNTFPTTEKPDGNPGFVTLWTEVYLRIHKEFPELFDILVGFAGKVCNTLHLGDSEHKVCRNCAPQSGITYIPHDKCTT